MLALDNLRQEAGSDARCGCFVHTWVSVGNVN